MVRPKGPARAPGAGTSYGSASIRALGTNKQVDDPRWPFRPRLNNEKVGLALFCPITNQVKGYPFEVTVPAGLPVTGVLLADQIKSLDWRERRAELIERMPEATIREVLQKLRTLLPGIVP